MAALGTLWGAFVVVAVFFVIAVSFAVVLTVREGRGVSLRSALPKALNKAVTGGIFLAAAIGMYGAAKLFHISHADWLVAPAAGIAIAFLQPDRGQKFKQAVSALAFAIATIVCADVLQAAGVRHPLWFTFGAVAVIGAAIPLYGRLQPVARGLWLGL